MEEDNNNKNDSKDEEEEVEIEEEEVESIESIPSSPDILSSIFFVIKESISSGLHHGYTVTIVTIHKFISGNDSFGIRYAEKAPINTISTRTRIVVLHCFTQNQKNQPDNSDLALLSCSHPSII